MPGIMIQEKPKIEQIISLLAQLPLQDIPTLKMRIEDMARKKLDRVLVSMRGKTADTSEEEILKTVNEAVNQVRSTREKVRYEGSN
ncbi:MAG: hypothetical protein ABIF11_04025 [Nitrospirota bacterium]